MSNDKPTPGPILVNSSETAEVAQPNWLQRNVINPIRTRPKTALAIVGGAVLVGAAAFAGRQTAPYDLVVELKTDEEAEEETVTVIDTSS